jgi:NADH-quinone oxidoreductase subunit D
MGTPIIYMFREREKIVDFFDMVCGQRLTHNYMRIGGVSHDFPPEFFPAMKKFVREMPRYIDEYDQLLKENEIVLVRSIGVGIVTDDLAVNASLSGPMLRATGIRWDIRKADPYSVYDRLDFEIPTGTKGDAYDRYRVRVEEMRQSVRIIEQALEQLPEGPIRADVPNLIRPPKGEVYSRIESPKGELGFYLVSDGSIAPYRFRIRPPAMLNLGVLREMMQGWKVGDLIIILGSVDMALGEVDR